MRLRLLALVGLALAAVPISSRLHLEVVGRTAVGEVTALESKTDSDGDKTYAPVIALTTAAGQRVTLHGMSVSPPIYAIGERVQVLYDPADPAASEIGSPLARWWLWSLVVAVCLVLALPARTARGRLARFRAARYAWARALALCATSIVIVVSPLDRVLARGSLAVFGISAAVFALGRLRLARCPSCELRFPDGGEQLRDRCPHCALDLDARDLPLATALRGRGSSR
jgi:hypothetical protein